MVETREVELDGDTKITLVQLPSMRAIKLLPRLGRLIGPALSALASGNLMDANVAALGGALDEVLQRLTADELESLIRELLGNAKCGGKDLMPVFDNVFRGRTLQVFVVLKHALDLNFGDFSAALAGLADKAKAARADRSSSQTT